MNIPVLNDLNMYARFCCGLKGFLREKISFDEAKRIIKTRMEDMEKNFLEMMRKAVFEYKDSPYLALMRLSDYGYRDIEKLVRSRGIEESLRALKEGGVYLSTEEFKGRKPVIRKGRVFNFRGRDFENPYLGACYERLSGATRSSGSRIKTNWSYLADKSVYRALMTEVHNLSGSPHIMIQNIFPYGPGIIETLHLTKFNIYPLKLISTINERRAHVSFKFRLALAYIFYMSRLLGMEFPKDEFIDIKDISKISDIIVKINKEYRSCCVVTYVSTALRICLNAKERGIALEGVVFNVAGEPLTIVAQKEIESTGAKISLYYAFTEAGVVGAKCANPSCSDDVHLFSDHLALISHKRKVLDEEVDSFLFTTFLPSAPKIMLNVENGDYGIIEKRDCGCPYDDLGFKTHLHNIRSFEKLTGEGMTFYGPLLAHVATEVFPKRFGGHGLDYQFVEEKDEKGLTRLIIFVSPEVGQVDENEIIAATLGELKKGGYNQRMMAEVWSDAETIQVRRNYPVLTKSGKLYPLHIAAKT